jgi:hypothetical protein
MTLAEIEEMARQPKEPEGALGTRLTELRSRGAGILECIRYVWLNQGCSLAKAGDIVVNSQAWADQKEEFLRQQWDALEEFLADNRGRIEAIDQTITPQGTKVVVHMKSPIAPGENTADPGAARDPGRM